MENKSSIFKPLPNKGLFLKRGDHCWSWLTVPQTVAMLYLEQSGDEREWQARLLELIAITLKRMNKHCPDELKPFLDRSDLDQKLHRTAYWFLPPMTELKMAFVTLPDTWSCSTTDLFRDPFLQSVSEQLKGCSFRLP
ncbi:hypothetical protein JXQ70_00760 [bacterium]|nr:hypothetical protein [bacterium]